MNSKQKYLVQMDELAKNIIKNVAEYNNVTGESIEIQVKRDTYDNIIDTSLKINSLTQKHLKSELKK